MNIEEFVWEHLDDGLLDIYLFEQAEKGLYETEFGLLKWLDPASHSTIQFFFQRPESSFSEDFKTKLEYRLMQRYGCSKITSQLGGARWAVEWKYACEDFLDIPTVLYDEATKIIDENITHIEELIDAKTLLAFLQKQKNQDKIDLSFSQLPYHRSIAPYSHWIYHPIRWYLMYYEEETLVGKKVQKLVPGFVDEFSRLLKRQVIEKYEVDITVRGVCFYSQVS
jgi:hypothetical protein